MIFQDSSRTYNIDDECWEYRNSDGRFHRDGDKPAIVCMDGEKFWYQDGKLHRDGDKPANIQGDGTAFYWEHGDLNREGDKPAIVTPSGHRRYIRKNKFYREGGKPAIIHTNGCMMWFYKDTLIFTKGCTTRQKDEWEGFEQQGEGQFDRPQMTLYDEQGNIVRVTNAT